MFEIVKFVLKKNGFKEIIKLHKRNIGESRKINPFFLSYSQMLNKGNGNLMMKLYFLTKNDFKYNEAKVLLPKSIELIKFSESIKEIQSENIDEIVNDKILKAFKKIYRPIFIEHTSLYLEGLNDFPGGLTQIFWDKLGADDFSKFISLTKNCRARAKTIIGFCDGKRIHTFEGSIDGSIASIPRGKRDFQWDCVFIPNGYNKTFAQLGSKKNEISMRKIAFDKFNKFLEGYV